MAGAGMILVVYAYRHQVVNLVLTVSGVGVMWRMLQHRFFPRRRSSRRGLVELGAGALVGAAVARRRVTHPCVQCGKPIGAPSRAAYCSPGCREYARLERAKRESDARALAAFGDEVPF
jgi:hypothetical protein